MGFAIDFLWLGLDFFLYGVPPSTYMSMATKEWYTLYIFISKNQLTELIGMFAWCFQSKNHYIHFLFVFNSKRYYSKWSKHWPYSRRLPQTHKNIQAWKFKENHFSHFDALTIDFSKTLLAKMDKPHVNNGKVICFHYGVTSMLSEISHN